MSPANRIGWATLLTLAVFAAAMAIATRCHAEPRLVERLIAAQRSLASRTEQAVDARELAEAIASIPKVSAQWAALVLTVAAHESALRARIARGECRPLECDGGRAWGLYQGHRNALNAEAWGSPDLRVQTLEAARALRSAFYQCGGLQPGWVARTLSAYAGHRCDASWRGLDRRLLTHALIVRGLK